MRFFSSLLLAGCAAAWEADYVGVQNQVGGIAARLAAPPDPRTEQELAGTLTRDLLARVAIQRNPALRQAAERAQAAVERVPAAAALDDPMLRIESWNVPTAVGFDRSMNMLGITQTLPIAGNLDLRAEAALAEAEELHQEYRTLERDIVLRISRAFIEYAVATRELEIRREHIRILDELEKISDTRFRTGTVPQQDVLKPQIELILLHNEVLFLQQRIATARAQINSLLNRPPESVLGLPAPLAPPEEQWQLSDLLARSESRPELLAAAARLRSSRAEQELAEREGAWPELALAADYQRMPDGADTWGGMIMINLPWITGKRAAEARSRKHRTLADQAAVERIRREIQREVQEAYHRLEAARKSVLLFKGELLPKSTQSLDVTRAGYQGGRTDFLDLLDAERSLREVKIGYERALGEKEMAVAELERAVGSDLTGR